MQDVYVKLKVPETYQECVNTNCEKCLFKCGSHAESFLRERPLRPFL